MSGKYMRKCNKCGVKHAPPTGAKCAMVYSDDDQPMPSLPDGDSMNEMLNWAGVGGSSKQDTGYYALDSEPHRFSPNKVQYEAGWPCLSKKDQIKSETRDTEVTRKVGSKSTSKIVFESDVSKSDLKAVKDDVVHVKNDLDRVAAETRSSLAKLLQIEDLLRQS